jgi:hypothetical protein
MPCVLTQGYNLDCRLNYGGVKDVYLIEFDNVASVTQSAGVVTAITKVATKVFRKYALIAHTGESDEALTASREMGTLSNKQTIKFPINKMTVAVRNELFLLAQNRLMFVFVDENGTNWLYGGDYGLTLTTASAKTGKVLADRNGYELTFEGDEKNLAYEVNAATLATLLT